MIIERWINEKEKLRVDVLHDEGAESPRVDSSPLGRFVGLPDRRFAFGDERQEGDDARSPREALADRVTDVEAHGGMAFNVWCHEHGMVVMCLSRGSDLWDTRQAGAILLTAEEIARAQLDVDRLEEMVAAELEDYTSWMNGEVFYAQTYRGTQCSECGHWDWARDPDRASGGFYGTDHVRSGLYEQMDMITAAESPEERGWIQAEGV